jgi:hypothetical protein
MSKRDQKFLAKCEKIEVEHIYFPPEKKSFNPTDASWVVRVTVYAGDKVVRIRESPFTDETAALAFYEHIKGALK